MDIALEGLTTGFRQRPFVPGTQGQGFRQQVPNERPPRPVQPQQNYQDQNYNNNHQNPNNFNRQNNYRQQNQQRQGFQQQRQQQPRQPQQRVNQQDYNSDSFNQGRPPRQQDQQQQRPMQTQRPILPPRFPPNSQRQYQEPRQEQERAPRNQQYRNNQNNYREQNNEQDQQYSQNQRRPYKQEGGYNRQRQEQDGDQRQPNPRYKGNNPQPYNNRTYTPQQRQEYQQQQADRGRGRGRGQRGRGRGGFNGGPDIQQKMRFPPPPPPNRKIDGPKQLSEEQKSQKASISEEQYQSSHSSQEQSQQSSERSQNQSESNQKSSLSEQQRSQSSQEIQGQAPVQSQQSEVQSRYRQQNKQQIEEQPINHDNSQQIHVMCSKQQYNLRLEDFNLANRALQGGAMRLDTGRSFAIFQINKRTNEPDFALTLKRYRRSTNRSQDTQQRDEETDLPRSTRGLMQAIKLIQEQIIDADNVVQKDLAFPLPPGQKRFEFLHIFDFLWNRMREMIKDVSRLPDREKNTKQIILMCEEMLRFFVIATREGRLPHKCKLQFDPKLNIESITKILTQLLEIYEESHMKLKKQKNSNAFISPNEPQIMAYAIIISNDIQNTLNQKLRIKLNGQGLDHPLLQSKQIQTAFKITKALRCKDFQTFYKVLQDEETDYVLTCLLMHKVTFMRSEALKMMARSSEQKTKKVPQYALIHTLRFKNSQYRQFQELIQQIGATISIQNGQRYVSLNNIETNLHDIAVATSFKIDESKLSRKRLGLKPCRKRLNNPDLISRQQFTKKSWFQGDYDQLVRAYYKGQSFEPKIIPKKLAPIKQNKPKDLSLQKKTAQPNNINLEPILQQSIQQDRRILSSPKTTSGAEPMNFLKMKKKQLLREKFIKILQGHTQTLIKNSDIHCQHQRKKGLLTMLQLLDFSRLLTLQASFYRIYEFSGSKNIIDKSLSQLDQYKNIKQEFFNMYNQNTFQFKRKEKVQFVKMSALLRSNKKKKESSFLKELFTIYKQSNPTNTKSKNLKILYIINYDPKKPFSETQIKFFIKFYQYVTLQQNQPLPPIEQKIRTLIENISDSKKTNKIQFQKKIFEQKENEKIELNYSLTLLFNKLSSNKNEIPFVCGYNPVFFIDFSQAQGINTILQKLKQSKQIIMSRKNSNSSYNIKTNFTILHVGSGQNTWQKSSIKEILNLQQKWKKNFNIQSQWFVIEREHISISSLFKKIHTSILKEVISKPEISLPSLEICSFGNLLGQIQRNLQCSNHSNFIIQRNSLQFFELYFNQNLQYLKNSILKIGENYENYDWSEIIQQGTYLRPSNQKHLRFKIPPSAFSYEDGVNLNQQLLQKFLFPLQLIDFLQFRFIQVYKEIIKRNSQEHGLYYLCQIIQRYFQGLNRQQLQNQFHCVTALVIQNNCRMKFQDKTIQGQCKDLFYFLISKLKEKLKYNVVFLPKGFQFKIAKDKFVLGKQKEIMRSTTVSETVPAYSAANKQKDVFIYRRASLLSELLQEIQEESDNDEKSTCIPYKKIKVDCV